MRSNTLLAASSLVSALVATGAQAADTTATSPRVHYRYEQVDEVKVFYREAGSRDDPTVLLLHGFPTSSFMYRNLIPLLADRYHVVAPDLPGFGLTHAPEDGRYAYTFEQLSKTLERFTEQLHLDRYAIQVFDYGAPVGWRLAVAHPERITAIISQNGNAYEEGLSEGWQPIREYWRYPSPENRAAVRKFMTPAALKWQYTHGVDDESLIAPETYLFDATMMASPGSLDIQLDLILNYADNVAQYPEYQAYFRRYQPPLLAVWGRNDPFFLPAGAEAWKRDIPTAEVHFYDTGHFALETHATEIGTEIKDFLDRHLRR